MTNALLAKNKFGFMDETLICPSSDSPDAVAWIKSNSMVISWIFNSLHPSLHDNVAYLDTAREMWIDLEECFPQGNAPRVHQLKMDIVNTQHKDLSVDLATRKLIGMGELKDGFYYFQEITILVASATSTCDTGLEINFMSMLPLATLLVILMAIKDIRWQAAMQHELETNQTWTLQKLPPAKKAIGCKRVEELDCTETFAPVAKLTTVRTLLAAAAAKHWVLHQFDVHNAFIHGDLNEEVYMKRPSGYLSTSDDRVCWLRKSLYGLKRASRQCFAKFSTAILRFGFTQYKADTSLFLHHKGTSFTAILVYVNDVIIATSDISHTKALKQYLTAWFPIKDLGNHKYFLGLEVGRCRGGIAWSQRKYTLDILREAGMLASKPVHFPIEQNHKLALDDSDLLDDPSFYSRLIGRLIYLTITRPDICYSVHILSQFMHQPRQGHWQAALRILRYLKLAPSKGLFLSTGSDLVKHNEIDCHFIRDCIQRGLIVSRYIASHNQSTDLFTKALGKQQFQFLVRKLGIRNLHAPT
ncbi:Cysteine-rich RLK (RECEPTOR-like protein kinase) 8 [Theobroma cacao]|uniref:Cysteine-rich RLK (RECEPTOR-like protein kinase) 8 n=1 Tax=Theobroma cacao TaxID=3641 RepID=A0A061F1H9_THECC|nr:Cysteine-rich RLK (RECEPTOR-like protein kinase) 8 [Theobroma cacao]